MMKTIKDRWDEFLFLLVLILMALAYWAVFGKFLAVGFVWGAAFGVFFLRHVRLQKDQHPVIVGVDAGDKRGMRISAVVAEEIENGKLAVLDSTSFVEDMSYEELREEMLSPEASERAWLAYNSVLRAVRDDDPFDSTGYEKAMDAAVSAAFDYARERLRERNMVN